MTIFSLILGSIVSRIIIVIITTRVLNVSVYVLSFLWTERMATPVKLLSKLSFYCCTLVVLDPGAGPYIYFITCDLLYVSSFKSMQSICLFAHLLLKL